MSLKILQIPCSITINSNIRSSSMILFLGIFVGCLLQERGLELNEAVTFSVEFDSSTGNLPARILFPNPPSPESDSFYFLAQDYRKSYSKIVLWKRDFQEFDLIFETDSAEFIGEVESGHGLIIWTVSSKSSPAKQSLYLFNIQSARITQLASSVHPGFADEISMAVRPVLSDNSALWISQDSVEQKSKIMHYSISDSTIRSIVSSPFVENINTPIPWSILFVNVSYGRALYSKRITDSTSRIVIHSLSADTTDKIIPNKSDVSFNFGGSFNESGNNIALYGKAQDAEQIYVLNLEDNSFARYVGFSENAFAFQDRIRLKANQIYYVSYQQVSGYIKDMYKGEIYRFPSGGLRKINFLFDFEIFGQTRYQLSFDETEGPNKIHFQIVEEN